MKLYKLNEIKLAGTQLYTTDGKFKSLQDSKGYSYWVNISNRAYDYFFLTANNGLKNGLEKLNELNTKHYLWCKKLNIKQLDAL